MKAPETSGLRNTRASAIRKSRSERRRQATAVALVRTTTLPWPQQQVRRRVLSWEVKRSLHGALASRISTEELTELSTDQWIILPGTCAGSVNRRVQLPLIRT